MRGRFTAFALVFEWGGFFDDNVGIGTNKAEGTNSSQTPAAPCRPRLSACRYPHRQALPRQMGIGPLKMQVRRDLAFLQAQHNLDQPGDASSGFEVADIRFY